MSGHPYYAILVLFIDIQFPRQLDHFSAVLHSSPCDAMMAGYSGTPLAKKLGIKPGFRVKTRNAPADYNCLLNPIPQDVSVSTRLRGEVDLWHFFTASRKELSVRLESCLKEIKQNGMIWVSWPKKSSDVPSDVTETTIREVALPLGLVDVKVCAFDETWSGLKLVIRKVNRLPHHSEDT